ncbi:MAG TPA: hypothetical protein VJ570_12960 [Holophagaceae bacterium]|nr:hypothetical protein [Holophagaceae bacterium]
MRIPALLVPALALLAGGFASAQSAIPQLTVVGKVTQLKPAPPKEGRDAWIATLAVAMVESGDYTDQALAFQVHASAKSKLQVGKRYRIRVEKLGGRFTAQAGDIRALN